MAELLVREEYLGDVVVLHMAGRITIGEGSVTLRTAVRSLLEKGHQKLVWNLSGIRYIDSSGLGEVVASYTAISKNGGRVVLCHLTSKIQDLFTIEKLLMVFDVYDDVGEALGALSATYRFFLCPLERCNKRVTLLHSPPGSFSATCSACYAQFEILLLADDETTPMKGVIRSLRLPTYGEKYIKVTIGSPSTIEVSGRLDLFVSDVLRKAWQVIPVPRRIIFDISAAGEISRQGLEILYGLCSQDEETSQTVILSGSPPPLDFSVTSIPVWEHRTAAVAALGETTEEDSYQLTVELFEKDRESQS